MMRKLFLVVLYLTMFINLTYAQKESSMLLNEWSFAKGEWNIEDWVILKSPRFDVYPAMVQKEGHIENRVPENATKKELMGKLAGETYTPMLFKEPFSGKKTLSCTMEFDDRMAPGIVIANRWGKSTTDKPELREHIEVILFDEGVNVWFHFLENGKQTWKKAAHAKATFLPQKRYKLEVKIEEIYQAWYLEISVENLSFGALVPKISEDYYVGLVGCEGLNKFYNFSVK